MQIIPLVLSAFLLTAASRAGEHASAPNQIAIVSTTDVWSEIAACG